ncbi:MAG TPA: AMP-binding protein [Ktedonobacteraceae bacterium]|nr:AMP-binding protein [Chthonomonadales bacterium]HEV2581430.1 AMP-binding protein [Ktedonobacteraceae bacterium]
MEENVYRTELTPVSFLQRSAFVFPDKTAVIHGDRQYTYREFAERVNHLASSLRAFGLQKHDRVAFLCPNTPALLEAHFAVPAAGGILVAVNSRLNAQEIDYILQHAGAKFLFAGRLEGGGGVLQGPAIVRRRVPAALGFLWDPCENRSQESLAIAMADALTLDRCAPRRSVR